MEENNSRDDRRRNMAKRALLLKLMRERFEKHVAEILENKTFQSMDELDTVLEQELKKYYAEAGAVDCYYEQKCS